jgi:hypothetical protein
MQRLKKSRNPVAAVEEDDMVTRDGLVCSVLVRGGGGDAFGVSQVTTRGDAPEVTLVPTSAEQ